MPTYKILVDGFLIEKVTYKKKPTLHELWLRLREFENKHDIRHAQIKIA